MKQKINSEIAYLSGVLAGDGSISIRREKHDYAINCVGNPKDEQEYYHKIICPMIEKLFDKKTIPTYHNKKTTFGIRFSSKKIVNFFVNELEHPVGEKYHTLKIPEKIKQKNLTKHFIRGVADTDFCISFKKRNRKIPYYPVISGTSKSKSFIEEIAIFLELEGMSVSKLYDYKQIDKRFKKGFAITSSIYIYGFKNLGLWMKKIGFSSPKHLGKIKKFGKKHSGGWI